MDNGSDADLVLSEDELEQVRQDREGQEWFLEIVAESGTLYQPRRWRNGSATTWTYLGPPRRQCIATRSCRVGSA
jgi:hypothetical protein